MLSHGDNPFAWMLPAARPTFISVCSRRSFRVVLEVVCWLELPAMRALPMDRQGCSAGVVPTGRLDDAITRAKAARSECCATVALVVRLSCLGRAG